VLGCRMVAAGQDGGCSKGPLQMGLADCGVCRAVPFPGGCPGTCDQAARGDNILAPGDAVDIMDVVEEHEAEHLADAGHGLPQRPGGGVRVSGGGDDGACDVAQQRIVGGEQRQSNCDTLLSGWSGTALGHPRAGRFVGDLFANGREVLLASGLLPGRQELGPFVRQRQAAPQHVTGGAPVGGIDRGLREPAATEQSGNLWRIPLGIFGLPAMDGLHGEGMTADKGEAFVGTEVGEPVPGEHACDGNDETLSRRSNDVQEGRRIGLHGTVHQDRTAL